MAKNDFEPLVREVRSTIEYGMELLPWLLAGSIVVIVLKRHFVPDLDWLGSFLVMLGFGFAGIPVEAVARRWGRMGIVWLMMIALTVMAMLNGIL
jgi:hypothetical protein